MATTDKTKPNVKKNPTLFADKQKKQALNRQTNGQNF